MTDRRIPVYLLTGYLGSGKTTLLAAWLREPQLADAALVINEIGEVGLDDRLLGFAAEGSALVANSCVCCTGLPGLEEALADLFWARLHRQIPHFEAVVIETTGLADPRPVMAALASEGLLKERYRLAGVVTTVSATAGLEMIEEHDEAVAQVMAADVVIVTKVDRVGAEAAERLRSELQRRVQALQPEAVCVLSSRGSFSAGELMSALPGASGKDVGPSVATHLPHAEAHAHDVLDAPETRPASNGRHASESHDSHEHHEHAAHEAHQHHESHASGHDHVHDADTTFMPIPEPLSAEDLHRRVERLVGAYAGRLLRVKGIVRLLLDTPVTVQWAPGDGQAEVQPWSPPADAQAADRPYGLTVIFGAASHWIQGRHRG